MTLTGISVMLATLRNWPEWRGVKPGETKAFREQLPSNWKPIFLGSLGTMLAIGGIASLLNFGE